MKHTMDDVYLGDEVIFDSTEAQSNHDLYWTVIGKINNHVIIELKVLGFDENWSLKIDEVNYILPTSMLRGKSQNQVSL